MTTLVKLQREGADTIFIANRTQWGVVPYPKVGLAHPQPRETTVWKKEPRGNRQTVGGSTSLKFSPFKRPIYMTDSMADLNRYKITSDVNRLNIVVAKPFPTRRQFNALFKGPKWAKGLTVTYYGVWGVPEVDTNHLDFSPRVARTNLQRREREYENYVRKRE